MSPLSSESPTPAASDPGLVESGIKDRHIVTALSRGLQVLRCFTHERPELSASDIVRMTGLPQPTVWRLCRTLTSEGLLVCAGEPGRMALGLPVLSLGYAALVRQPMARLALPRMQEITARLRLGTSLAVPTGLEMAYVQRTHGDFIYFNDPVGTRRPMATAPTAWACLAAWAPDQRAETLEAIRHQDPKSFPAIGRHILGAVEEYAHHGLITSIGVMHEHFNAVAVPVRGPDGQWHGLSAAGLAALWPRERLLHVGKELIALAQDLTTVPA